MHRNSRKHIRLLEGEIARFGRIVGQVVQLPLAVVVAPARKMQGDGMPPIAVVPPMPVELLVLLAVMRSSVSIDEQRSEARACQWIHGKAVARRGPLEPHEIEQGGQHVGHVRVLRAQGERDDPIATAREKMHGTE